METVADGFSSFEDCCNGSKYPFTCRLQVASRDGRTDGRTDTSNAVSNAVSRRGPHNARSHGCWPDVTRSSWECYSDEPLSSCVRRGVDLQSLGHRQTDRSLSVFLHATGRNTRPAVNHEATSLAQHVHVVYSRRRVSGCTCVSWY